MSNVGVAPVDSETEIGQLRIALGDTNSVPLEPDEPGFANYEWFSDSELEQMIVSADGSLKRAEGYGLQKFARYLAMSATDIQTDDLRIKTIERAKLMRDLANDALAAADDEDARVDSDIFAIHAFPGFPRAEKTWPEASPRPYVL